MTSVMPSDSQPPRLWPYGAGAVLIIGGIAYYFTQSVLLTLGIMAGAAVGVPLLVLLLAAGALVFERKTWSHKGPSERRTLFDRLMGV